jgi:hypothetical protein
LRLIRALGLEPFFLDVVKRLDAGLRKWPWLYERLS